MTEAGIRLHWIADVVDLPSASIPEKICVVRGGESVTIKHIGTSSKYIMIGDAQDVSSTKGFKLSTTLESITISLDARFGRDKYIEVWGLPETAGDDVCIIKVIGYSPKTASD